jgi:hypothetical protein
MGIRTERDGGDRARKWIDFGKTRSRWPCAMIRDECPASSDSNGSTD